MTDEESTTPPEESTTPGDESTTPVEDATTAPGESDIPAEESDDPSDEEPAAAEEAAASPDEPTTPAIARRDSVREKAQQVQLRQARMRLARRAAIAFVVLVVVGAIAAVVVGIITNAVSKPQLTPANVVNDGIVVDPAGTSLPSLAANGTLTTPTPSPSAEPEQTPEATEATPSPSPTPSARSVDIQIYVDYLAEGAGTFQLANAKQLSEWVRDRAVTVSYHPVALLTSKSNGTKYSLRAASAAACVASMSPQSFFAYNHELLAEQPKVDTDGMTDEQLADIAIAVGADDPKGVRSCIETGTYTSWVKGATERALASPLPGSTVKLTNAPMILVDGIPYVGALASSAEFAQFVLNASSKAYYQTPSPTATPTPTAAPEPTPTP